MLQNSEMSLGGTLESCSSTVTGGRAATLLLHAQSKSVALNVFYRRGGSRTSIPTTSPSTNQ